MSLLIAADTVAPERWRNGGGATRELLADGPGWAWRISLADIDADGPFSAFDGVRRWFAVVAGNGVELDFADGACRVLAGTEPIDFDGAAAPCCRLIDGPTRDLNLMLRANVRGVLRRGAAFDEAWPLRGRFDVATCTLHWNLPPGALRADPASLWIGIAP